MNSGEQEKLFQQPFIKQNKTYVEGINVKSTIL